MTAYDLIPTSWHVNYTDNEVYGVLVSVDEYWQCQVMDVSFRIEKDWKYLLSFPLGVIFVACEKTV